MPLTFRDTAITLFSSILTEKKVIYDYDTKEYRGVIYCQSHPIVVTKDTFNNLQACIDLLESQEKEIIEIAKIFMN